MNFYVLLIGAQLLILLNVINILIKAPTITPLLANALTLAIIALAIPIKPKKEDE
jgi:hypothetical protein